MDNVVKEMEESVSKYEEQLQIMIDEMEDIRQINCNKNPWSAAPSKALENNPKSIHFTLEQRGQRILVEYNNRVSHDLELRGMDSTSGSLKERQEQLRLHMILEWVYKQIKSSVDVSKEMQAKALFLILNTVLCILHAENRMGINILTMLLVEGLSEYVQRSSLGERSAVLEFVQKLEEIINTKILGDEVHDAQWVCPVSDNKMEIGQINMTNVRTRKIMKRLDLLLPLCVPNKQCHEKWKTCICEDYHDMLELLLSHRNLMPEEIKMFQMKADGFFGQWVALWGD
ncbi:hypothetical protein ACA910_002661 [Epithemia clementina (nom. ined.)]